MRLLLVTLLIGGCVVPLDEVTHARKTKPPSPELMSRCNYLRTWRDLYANFGIALGALGGATGLTSIGFEQANSKRHVAELGLGIAALGALFGAIAKTTGDAYGDEGCADAFALYRQPWQSSNQPPPDAAQPDDGGTDAAGKSDGGGH
jgi:hypothetical protein